MSLNKGLYTDGEYSQQPDGTWRYMKNGVIISKESDFLITNEKGNTNLGTLEGNPIGKIILSQDNAILFLDNNIILKIDKFGNKITIANDSLFNFNVNNPIQGTFSFNSKGETIIYWVDGLNSPRYLNIDNIPIISEENISLFLLYSRPSITLKSLNDTGGSLTAGVYQFGIQLFDKDFNPTNVISITNPISVNNDPKTSSLYDGAESGLATSKSITLDITKVPNNMKFYKIAVIKTEDSVESYFLSPLFEISSNFDFTFVYNSNNSFEISTAEFFQKQFGSYTTAETINQIYNILLLGGLKQNLDLDYQHLANNITVSYITEEFNMNDIKSNYTNELSNTNSRSFMRDEVYALGIVWMLDDGTESFVYHIPGRIKLDTIDTSSGTDILLGYSDPVYGNISKWKVVSTAASETIPSAGTDVTTSTLTYRLGYWESPTELYPNTSEWGSLANTPVRHHKMPNISQSPYYRYFYHVNPDTSTYETVRIGRRLKLSFTNIALPEKLTNKVKGFKIVKVERDNSNKSVLYQGELFNYTHRETVANKPMVINSFPFSGRTAFSTSDLGTSGGSPANIQNEHAFYSPELQFNLSSEIVPDYLEQEEIFYSTDQSFWNTHGTKNTNIYEGGLGDKRFVLVGNALYQYFLPFNDSNKRLNITRIIKVSNNSQNVDFETITIDNRNAPSHIAVANSGSQLSYPADVLTNAGISSSNILDFSIEAVSNGGGQLDSSNGDFIGFQVYLSTMKKKYYPQYFGLDNLSYIETGYTYYLPDLTSLADYNSSTIHTPISGDTFISNFWFRRTVQGNKDYFKVHNGFGWDSNTNALCAALNWCPIQSLVNIDFRHSGLDLENPDISWATKYYPQATDYEGNGNSVVEQPGYIDNYYAYNVDYSKENTFKEYVAKPINFEQITTFNTRIAYSQTKSSEDNFDAFRQFLINDYKDLPLNKGRLVNININENRVQAHLENSLFIIPSSETRFQVTEGTVNIGTGSFLEQIPLEILNIDGGFAGIKSKSQQCMTPSGYFFIDSDRGKVYLYNNQIKDLTMGMQSFFRDNSRFILAEQFLAHGVVIPTDALNPLGYTVEFDQILNRVIIYKSDIQLIDDSKIVSDISNPANSGDIYFYNHKFWVYVLDTGLLSGDSDQPPSRINGSNTYVPFQLNFDGSNSLDKSYTLSYSLDTNSWVSFHNYKPLFMWRLNDLFSYYNGSIYKHNSNNYGKFDDSSPYLFEVQLVFNSPFNKDKLFKFYSIATKCYDENNVFKLNTFDSIIAFNSYQCSGELNLTNLSNLRRTNGLWNINKIRDIVKDHTLPFISNFRPINTNIDNDKVFYQKGRFKDSFIVFHHILNNSNNFKLYLYDAGAVFNDVYR